MVALGAPLGARPLLESQLQHLKQNRYVVVPDWITIDQTNRLKRDALTLDSLHGWDCHIGSNEKIQLDTSYRRSRQCNIYPPPSNAAGSVSTRAGMIAAVNALRNELQHSDLALPHLAPFETELNYLCYPSGGHYDRHLDQPYSNAGWVRCGRRASDGGSFGGQHTRRVISFILYLNRDWDAADGGCLRLFPPHERGYGSADSQLAAHTEDVLPEGGTLVLLMSGDVEHQVRETRIGRQCVVGWFRELESTRVPDLDSLSLRTLRLLDREKTLGSCAELIDSGGGEAMLR